MVETYRIQTLPALHKVFQEHTKDNPQITLASDGNRSPFYSLINFSPEKITAKDGSGLHPRGLFWHKDSPIHSHPDGNCSFSPATEGSAEHLFTKKLDAIQDGKPIAILTETRELEKGTFYLDMGGKDSEYIHQFVLPEEPVPNLTVITKAEKPGDVSEERSVYAVTFNLYEKANPGKPAGAKVFVPETEKSDDFQKPATAAARLQRTGSFSERLENSVTYQHSITR